MPETRRQHVATAARTAVVKVSAWLRANLVLAGVMGTFTAVGLGFLRVPYFYVVALVAAIGETVPMVGPIIAGLTAVAIALSVSTRLALDRRAVFPGAAPARGEHPRAEDHGAAGRREPGRP